MFFYCNLDCFCLSKEDREFYETIINNTIDKNEDIIVSNDYVCLNINNNQLRYTFSLNAVVNYEEQAFANWLLYVYDMCHSHISTLIDPNNQQRRKLPHMNAVKDVMYNITNMLIYEEKFNVINLIFSSIKKLRSSYTYDYYSLQADYLFFKFLLNWFYLSTNNNDFECFNQIINNNLTIINFKNGFF